MPTGLSNSHFEHRIGSLPDFLTPMCEYRRTRNKENRLEDERWAGSCLPEPSDSDVKFGRYLLEHHGRALWGEPNPYKQEKMANNTARVYRSDEGFVRQLIEPLFNKLALHRSPDVIVSPRTEIERLVGLVLVRHGESRGNCTETFLTKSYPP
jgi:hypothetical protein